MSLTKVSLADGKIANLFVECSFPKPFTRDTSVKTPSRPSIMVSIAAQKHYQMALAKFSIKKP
jgi:hypothetical protein